MKIVNTHGCFTKYVLAEQVLNLRDINVVVCVNSNKKVVVVTGYDINNIKRYRVKHKDDVILRAQMGGNVVMLLTCVPNDVDKDNTDETTIVPVIVFNFEGYHKLPKESIGKELAYYTISGTRLNGGC